MTILTREDKQYLWNNRHVVEELKTNYHKYESLPTAVHRTILQLLRKHKVLWFMRSGCEWTALTTPHGTGCAPNARYRVGRDYYPSIPVPAEPEYFDYPVDSTGHFKEGAYGEVYCYDAMGDSMFIGFKYKDSYAIITTRMLRNPQGFVCGYADKDDSGTRPLFPEFIRFFNPKFDKGGTA